MKHAQLKQLITRLALLPRSEAPIVSTFFDLKSNKSKTIEDLRHWAKRAKLKLPREHRDAFAHSVEKIQNFLATAEGVSASCHIRLGEHSFSDFSIYQAEMETSHHVGQLPILYPLVELKDKFKRFILVTTTAEKASIIEISLGTASVEAIAERDDPNLKTGKEWTREHYKNNLNERSKVFVKEKVSIIEQVCQRRHHDAIILAGEPRFVNRLKEALPKKLRSLVIDEIKTGVQDSRFHSVLQQAMDAYAKTEQAESLTAVNQLYHFHHSNGLASVGRDKTHQALLTGQAEKLIVASELELSVSEPLVTLAIQQNIEIETVTGSSILANLGGVGVILRYKDYSNQNSSAA